MYVLRKSYGPYSAGTRIEHMDVYRQPTQFCIFQKDVYVGLEIPADLVVERRSMTTTRPNVLNSRERRAIKRSERKRLLEVQNG